MVEDVKAEMKEKDEMQTITVTFDRDSQKHQAFYRRQRGHDTCFRFFGEGKSGKNESKQDSDIKKIRGDSDEILLEKGYPVRTADGVTPDNGELRIMFNNSHHSYPFLTNPNMFSVYHGDTMPADLELEENEIAISILSESKDELKIEYTDGGVDVPDYAVREAALFRYRIESDDQSLPTVEIVS